MSTVIYPSAEQLREAYRTQADYYRQATLHGVDGETSSLSRIGPFTSAGRRFQATVMNNSLDRAYVAYATGQYVDPESGMILRDPVAGETIDSVGAVLIEEIDRYGDTTGAYELLLPFEFNRRFSQNLPIQ